MSSAESGSAVMEEGLPAERSAAEPGQSVLVAGGQGFVGSHIVRALVRDG